MVKKRFGIVSFSVMADERLTLEAKALYALLACYCNANRNCFPSTKTLARITKKSNATIYRLLLELEKAKFISKIRQGRRRIIMMHDEILEVSNKN